MNRPRVGTSMRERGFTLVELMVVVAIATVLLTIAAAGYGTQIRKSRRTDAKTALLDLAGRQEAYFAVNNTYATTWSALGYSTAAGATTAPLTIGNGYYTVTITNVTNTTYTATAVPATPDQLKDTNCLFFTVTQTGAQTATNQNCWS